MGSIVMYGAPPEDEPWSPFDPIHPAPIHPDPHIYPIDHPASPFGKSRRQQTFESQEDASSLAIMEATKGKLEARLKIIEAKLAEIPFLRQELTIIRGVLESINEGLAVKPAAPEGSEGVPK